jgi:predicted GIY-YIG superfamily endonuclease
MVCWIYIIECEDNTFYIGKTTRLYRRFWEHQSGRGGVNTSNNNPEEILCIYKTDILNKFIDYDIHVSRVLNNQEEFYEEYLFEFDFLEEECDFIEAENLITEWMINNNGICNTSGGKYVRSDCNYIVPPTTINIPKCYCELPCDVKKNTKDNYLFFRCPRKNIWNDLQDIFEIQEPCNFFMKYTRDIEVRKEFELKKKLKLIEFDNRKKKLKELYNNCNWLNLIPKNDDNSCIECNIVSSDANKLSYKFTKTSLCFDCFINKNDELTNKYSNSVECIL